MHLTNVINTQITGVESTSYHRLRDSRRLEIQPGTISTTSFVVTLNMKSRNRSAGSRLLPEYFEVNLTRWMKRRLPKHTTLVSGTYGRITQVHTQLLMSLDSGGQSTTPLCRSSVMKVDSKSGIYERSVSRYPMRT